MQTAEYKFTDYFEQQVLRKRPYLKKEWCVAAGVDPDILRANTIVCSASIQEGSWNSAETYDAAPIDVLLISLWENEVSFTDKDGNVSFADKGEYWDNGNLLLAEVLSHFIQ